MCVTDVTRRTCLGVKGTKWLVRSVQDPYEVTVNFINIIGAIAIGVLHTVLRIRNVSLSRVWFDAGKVDLSSCALFCEKTPDLALDVSLTAPNEVCGNGAMTVLVTTATRLTGQRGLLAHRRSG